MFRNCYRDEDVSLCIQLNGSKDPELMLSECAGSQPRNFRFNLCKSGGETATVVVFSLSVGFGNE